MKKGKITMLITVSIICMILTLVMFVQFKTIKNTDITTIENMREDELRTEITSLKTKYDETAKKIEETKQIIAEYQETVTSEKEASELLAKELKQSSDLVGKNTVNGEGIIVTLRDSDTNKIMAEDLLKLLNELRLAGAEAISINDQRIVFNSYVVDINNKFISVSGEYMVSPYVVKAIGNPTYLESGLSKKQYGYIDTKLAEGKIVSIARETNIEISKYSKDLKFEYIETE